MKDRVSLRKGKRLESSARILGRLAEGMKERLRVSDELSAALSRYSRSAKPESFDNGVLVVHCGNGPERTEISLNLTAISAGLAKKGVRLKRILFR